MFAMKDNLRLQIFLLQSMFEKARLDCDEGIMGSGGDNSLNVCLSKYHNYMHVIIKVVQKFIS